MSLSFADKILQSPARNRNNSPGADLSKTALKRSKEAYRDALLDQMREQTQRKQEQRQHLRNLDQLDIEVYQRNYKFGVQQGGGAPLIARNGSPITRFQSIGKVKEIGDFAARIPSPELSKDSPNHSPTR